MNEPFIGEIRLFGGNFAPKGWALCNGQTLPINQNQALFSLLGTTYGGNGTTTFNLPDLRDRVPVHPGNNVVLGERAGSLGLGSGQPADAPAYLGLNFCIATWGIYPSRD